jgi:sugar phosphate isomerase/epimerase
MAAISGTFNMIDPDDRGREEGLSRLAVLADACQHLGTPVITLSTGTRDPLDMWRRHPDNDSRGAWRDLIRSVYRAVEDTESSGLTLAFEPEVSNVVDSAEKARKLLDEVRSPRLKVVMDPANLFHTGELQNARPIMEQAFSLLGDSIAIAHAKDLAKDGEAGHLAAGQGLLDYDQYLALLDASGFDGALVLHGLAESDVDASLAFLEAKLGAVAGQVGR